MSEIQNVIVMCVTHGRGVSRKSGSPKPYDFAQLEYIVPATNVDMAECNITNWGFQSKQFPVKNDPTVLAHLAVCPKLVPVTLILESDPRDFSKNIVVGFKSDQPVKDEFGGPAAAKDTGKDAKSEPVSKF